MCLPRDCCVHEHCEYVRVGDVRVDVHVAYCCGRVCGCECAGVYYVHAVILDDEKYDVCVDVWDECVSVGECDVSPVRQAQILRLGLGDEDAGGGSLQVAPGWHFRGQRCQTLEHLRRQDDSKQLQQTLTITTSQSL